MIICILYEDVRMFACSHSCVNGAGNMLKGCATDQYTTDDVLVR